jgi:tryptophan synthase alpha chain
MNKLNTLFSDKKKLLSIYFTAGFPELNSTAKILNELDNAGVDMIEIGIPFSDPLADGPVIQDSSERAIANGMNVSFLFEQLKNVNTKAPLILMGYFNSVMQFGVEKFCKQSKSVGVSGLIIPDLPIEVYLKEYKHVFQKYDLKNIFLISPQTSNERIKLIDKHSDAFIYAVSSSSTTGTKNGVNADKEKYFSRIKKMNLKNPVMIGFGISEKQSFNKACNYASGAIIGTAFIQSLKTKTHVTEFIKTIR